MVGPAFIEDRNEWGRGSIVSMPPIWRVSVFCVVMHLLNDCVHVWRWCCCGCGDSDRFWLQFLWSSVKFDDISEILCLLSAGIPNASVFHSLASPVPHCDCRHCPRVDATKPGGCGGGSGVLADPLTAHWHGCSVAVSSLHPWRSVASRHEHRQELVTAIFEEFWSFRTDALWLELRTLRRFLMDHNSSGGADAIDWISSSELHSSRHFGSSHCWVESTMNRNVATDFCETGVSKSNWSKHFETWRSDVYLSVLG